MIKIIINKIVNKIIILIIKIMITIMILKLMIIGMKLQGKIILILKIYIIQVNEKILI